MRFDPVNTQRGMTFPLPDDETQSRPFKIQYVNRVDNSESSNDGNSLTFLAQIGTKWLIQMGIVGYVIHWVLIF